MKKINFLLLMCIALINLNCTTVKKEKKIDYSFAFLTDIHLFPNNGNSSLDGFKKSITSIENNGVDFAITGGDNCNIHWGGIDSIDVAEGLYSDFMNVVNSSKVKIYPCIGNHDRCYLVDKDHKYYDAGLFEQYTGKKRYYSYDHKGWHFIIMDSGKQKIEEEQVNWLKNDLNKLKENTPIVVVLHVPFMSTYWPLLKGEFTQRDNVINQKEILDILRKYNTKLVLQGHQHIYEEILSGNIQMITAGAICGGWWGGPGDDGCEEGYLKINVYEDQTVDWEYIDYGWTVTKTAK